MNTTKKVYGLISFILLITMMGLSACSNSINNVIDEDDLPADSLGSRVSFELGMAEYADGIMKMQLRVLLLQKRCRALLRRKLMEK